MKFTMQIFFLHKFLDSSDQQEQTKDFQEKTNANKYDQIKIPTDK